MNRNVRDRNQNNRINRERFKELKKLIGDQEGRIQNIQTSAFQLANYYFVFQGVVLAAISNTSSLTCSDVWYIFTLSFIAATLNLFALFSIGSKYVRSLNLHDQTWSEYNELARNQNNPRAEPLEFHGAFSPANNNNNNNNNNNVALNERGQDEENNVEYRPWRDSLSLARRYALLTVCMLLFIAFTGVTLSGPWRVICKRDQYRRHHDMNLDCLKLCQGSRCMSFCQDT